MICQVVSSAPLLKQVINGILSNNTWHLFLKVQFVRYSSYKLDLLDHSNFDCCVSFPTLQTLWVSNWKKIQQSLSYKFHLWCGKNSNHIPSSVVVEWVFTSEMLWHAEVKDSGIHIFPSVSIQAVLRHHSISVDFERESHKRINCKNIVNCPLLSTVFVTSNMTHQKKENSKGRFGVKWCKRLKDLYELLSWICLIVRKKSHQEWPILTYWSGLVWKRRTWSNLPLLHRQHGSQCWMASRAETMLKNIILVEAAITMEDTVRGQEDSDFAVLDRTSALLWQAAIVIPLSQRTRAEDWPLVELRSLVPEKQGNHRFPAVSGETGRQLAIDLTLFATSRSWLTDKRGGTEEAE